MAELGTVNICSDCGAEIVWLLTAKSRMPVDAKPDPERGNVLKVGTTAGVLNPAKARAARAAGTELHLHHAVSCPYASRWQKPKGRAR